MCNDKNFNKLTTELSKEGVDMSGILFSLVVRTLQNIANKYIKTNNFIKCAICLQEECEESKESNIKYTFDCYHTFHKSCINNLVNDLCPLCRQPTVVK